MVDLVMNIYLNHLAFEVPDASSIFVLGCFIFVSLIFLNFDLEQFQPPIQLSKASQLSSSCAYLPALVDS